MGQTGSKMAHVVVLGAGCWILCSGTVYAVIGNPQANQTDIPAAARSGFEITLGIEMMTGETKYSVGAPFRFPDGNSAQGYFPLSELEWPLDIWLARVSARLDVGQNWRINGVVKTDITDPNDPMTDRDWLHASNPRQLDVYSTSDISGFSAFIFDVDVEWTFMQRHSWSLFTGIGYQYQKYEYDGSLVHQYSPSGQFGYEYFGNGVVTTNYEMTYSMPYLLVGTEFQITPAFIITGSLAYSPLVTAEDRDDHLLRSRVAKGDMDGDAYMIDLSGNYEFESSWFVEGGVCYTKIEVDGEIDISVYGIYVLTEREEAESSQTTGYFSLGYRF